MPAEATMARPKKATKPKKPSPIRTFGFKGTVDWGEWLGRFAEHQRTSLAGVIDRALAKLAEAEGFDEPPPPRVP
jgi:hypothetical protein